MLIFLEVQVAAGIDPAGLQRTVDPVSEGRDQLARLLPSPGCKALLKAWDGHLDVERGRDLRLAKKLNP